MAISLAEHDRGAVAPEQHHRVVDQAGQDLFEVQLAADVLGHSTQCIKSVHLLDRLVEKAGAFDKAGQLAGCHGQQLDIVPAHRCRAVADREQHAPGPGAAFDRDRDLRTGHRQHGLWPRRAGHRIGPDGLPARQRKAGRPESNRQVGQPGGWVGRGNRPGHEKLVADFEHGYQAVQVGLPEQPYHHIQGGVEIRVVGRGLGQLPEDPKVQLVSLVVEEPGARMPSRRGWTIDGPTPGRGVKV